MLDNIVAHNSVKVLIWDLVDYSIIGTPQDLHISFCVRLVGRTGDWFNTPIFYFILKIPPKAARRTPDFQNAFNPLPLGIRGTISGRVI